MSEFFESGRQSATKATGCPYCEDDDVDNLGKHLRHTCEEKA